MAKTTNRPFSSEKFDRILAARTDDTLTPSDLLVLLELIDHENETTGRIFPTEERLAILCGVDKRTVRRAVAHLRKRGWITVRRPDKAKSNMYSINRARVEAMLSIRKERLARARAARAARSRLRQHGEDARAPWAEDQNAPMDRTGVSPKHLE